MTKRLLLSVFLVGLIFSFTHSTLSAGTPEITGSNSAHITYVDGTAKVVHRDQTEHKAVVNLPVVPGDVVVTSDKGRCEVQFDNGTVIRLDKLSRLKVTTILAPSLTTKWRITTLRLQKGRIYVMNKTYNKEKFQVLTTNAAVDLYKSGASTIQLTKNGNTEVFVDRGKSRLMFGKDIQSIKTEKLKSGRSYTITSDHKFKYMSGNKNVDFVAWNTYVNKNFRELHRGISKVPKKIYRYNKALIYWAEKWSSLYGEWVYDDIFGYVWKPADEIFSYSKRPFFHADYVKINGKLYMVPQQPWGYAPAHLGTWVWMKWGWTWVPGNAYNRGICGFQTSWNWPMSRYWYPTLSYWMDAFYGGWDLYYAYRSYGYNRWKGLYYQRYRVYPKRPKMALAPAQIRGILKKINKTKISLVKDRFGENRPKSTISNAKLKRFLPKKMIASKLKRDRINRGTKTTLGNTPIATAKAYKDANEKKFSGGAKLDRLNTAKTGKVRNFRDFNPDVKWAIKNRHHVGYSSKSNAIISNSLKMNSREISSRGKISLRGSNGGRSRFHGTRGSSGSITSSSSSSGSKSSSSMGGLKSSNKK